MQAAGSYRRKKETVGDLDVLAISEAGKKVISKFVAYEDVEEVVSRGETQSTVVFRSGLQVDLRVVGERSHGAALLYFTGSKQHTIRLRNMARDGGLKINEYGVWDTRARSGYQQRVAGETEEAIYALLDLPWIPPELREDRGEVAAGRRDELPVLIELSDIKGDLQIHTNASAGRDSLEEMAKAARDLGREYLAVTDHSAYVRVTQGLEADELLRRTEEIKRWDDALEDIALLAGAEVDVMEDGTLGQPDEVLARLDVVVFAVHSHFGLSADEQTERIIRAMDNPHCNTLAHPTGRQIGKRSACQVEMARLMEAALERGCYLELSAQPERLDPQDVHCKMAKDRGLKAAISTDAHSTEELRFVQYGIDQARRGWLEPADVLNKGSLDDVRQLLAR